MQEGRRTQDERRAATREALLVAARAAFAEKGFATTGTPEIVAAAGVTRGALYHHFADKLALFAAVVEAEAAAIAKAIDAAAPGAAGGSDPIEALVLGGEGFLDAMADEGRRRILLIDAPAVLGREALDAIDARDGLRTLVEGIEYAMAKGAIQRGEARPLAQLLSALYDRAALAPPADAEGFRHAIAALIRGLARP